MRCGACGHGYCDGGRTHIHFLSSNVVSRIRCCYTRRSKRSRKHLSKNCPIFLSSEALPYSGPYFWRASRAARAGSDRRARAPASNRSLGSALASRPPSPYEVLI